MLHPQSEQTTTGQETAPDENPGAIERASHR